jgi:hypothetical protein
VEVEHKENRVTKRQKAQASRIASPEALVERGTEDLKAGRFKDAIESFRQLVKLEPRVEWQQSLAMAYAGRARTLAAKGMVKEAALVFDNADAANGTVHEPLMHLACLVRAGDSAKAAQLCTRLLGQDVPGISEGDRVRIADLAAALWLAGHPPPLSENERSPTRIFAAAEKALAAWIGGAPAEEVDGLLNAIPLRSPFKPLRLILKSLIGQNGDADRRDRLLDIIPADSAFSVLARAARLAGSGDRRRILTEWGTLSNAARTFVTEVRGQPAGSARLLTDLSDAERRGPDMLFDTLLKHAPRFPEADLRAACLNLLPRAPNRIKPFERHFGPLPAAERHRIRALGAGLEKNWNAFEDNWLHYARDLETAIDPDAALVRSIVYRHLAETAVEVPGLDRPYPGDEDVIAQWLEKSIEADPEDRAGVLKLIARLRETGNLKERNRWADLAVARFPADPAILTEALESAAERGAFRKAAVLAEKLLKVDPINALARQRLIELRIAHARKKLREGRADLAGKALDEAARRERRDAPDGALAIARGLVAVRAGRTEDGWAGVRAGVERLGGGVAGWLRAVLEARAMGFSDQEIQVPRRELTAALRESPTPEAVIAALAVLNRREFRDNQKLSAEGLKRIRRWLAQGSACAFSSAEFQTLAEIFERFEAFDLLASYAGAATAREPDEPLYEFHRIFAHARGKNYLVNPIDADRLEELVKKAGERKDVKLVYRIMDFLEGDLPPLYGPMDDADDAFEDDFPDDPFGGGPFGGGPFGGGPKPSQADLDAMSDLTDRIFELLETHSPNDVVDLLVKDFTTSPMGRGVPKSAVRSLFTLLVNAAADESRSRAQAGRQSRR